VAARRAKPKEVLLDVDTTARVAGIANSDFTSARQLGELLARTTQCQECIVKQVFRYMAGRSVTPADRPALNRALEAFRKSDFNFKSILVSLTKERDNAPVGGSLNVASNH
jgi:DNA invertase Pin-like site-specific DNA recombinase